MISKIYINKFRILDLFKILFNLKIKNIYDNTTKYSLKDINFSVRKGETVGIIGKNGAGKSTLLQIIAGTLKPTNGVIKTNGRITALLELGSGFNPDFTGIENIYLSGSILGISKKDMDSRINSIVDFADIGEYINKPTRIYSTGMLMRVAFSVAIAVDPDLLIIDEALGVGDFLFQQKCALKLKELVNKGISLLVVTHDTSFVLNMCRKAIWIDNGKMVFSGGAEECVRNYMTTLANVSQDIAKGLETKNKYKYEEEPDLEPIYFDKDKVLGGGSLIIDSIWILNTNNLTNSIYTHGDVCNIIIKVKALDKVYNASAGIELRDRLGQAIFVSGLRDTNNAISYIEKGTSLLIKIKFNLNLISGFYSIDIGCGAYCNEINSFYKIPAAFIINILESESSRVHGLVRLPYDIQVCSI
jgi:ABC-type polysaccharide/polyol phosphate transport system ATPase subunit